jgi:hypothetical protein
MNFVDKFLFKNTKIVQSMKICLVGAEIFHVDRETDGQIDMNNQTIAFCG